MRPCWPRLLLGFVIAALGTASLLSACGQKGPLYLPDDETPGEQRDAS